MRNGNSTVSDFSRVQTIITKQVSKKKKIEKYNIIPGMNYYFTKSRNGKIQTKSHEIMGK